MELAEIIEYSHKLYGQIERSGMTTCEAIVCADLLKNALLYNDFILTSQRIIKNEGQN